MIDEKKLIERIKEEPTDGMLTHEIIEAIEEQPKISQWIPCSERLPEKDGKYLVTYCDDLVENYVIERNFYNGQFEPMPYSEKNLGRKALAWQLLPEPYKG